MTKTLLEMAGADLTPPRFEEATLVVIDAQNEYVDGALPLPGVGEALGRISALLEAAPVSGEAVVEKALPNAFAGTNLQEVLEGFGRKQLVLAGFMTHMCVSSTARAALDLGYRTAVVSDASATRHLPAPGGGTIAAADLHAAELAALADRFSIVCRTADLVG